MSFRESVEAGLAVRESDPSAARDAFERAAEDAGDAAERAQAFAAIAGLGDPDAEGWRARAADEAADALGDETPRFGSLRDAAESAVFAVDPEGRARALAYARLLVGAADAGERADVVTDWIPMLRGADGPAFAALFPVLCRSPLAVARVGAPLVVAARELALRAQTFQDARAGLHPEGLAALPETAWASVAAIDPDGHAAVEALRQLAPAILDLLARTPALRARAHTDRALRDAVDALVGAVPALLPLSRALAATHEERVVVLHPESGRGFALTVDGVSTMRELAVLLGGAIHGEALLDAPAPDPAALAILDGASTAAVVAEDVWSVYGWPALRGDGAITGVDRSAVHARQLASRGVPVSPHVLLTEALDEGARGGDAAPIRRGPSRVVTSPDDPAPDRHRVGADRGFEDCPSLDGARVLLITPRVVATRWTVAPPPTGLRPRVRLEQVLSGEEVGTWFARIATAQAGVEGARVEMDRYLAAAADERVTQACARRALAWADAAQDPERTFAAVSRLAATSRGPGGAIELLRWLRGGLERTGASWELCARAAIALGDSLGAAGAPALAEAIEAYRAAAYLAHLASGDEAAPKVRHRALRALADTLFAAQRGDEAIRALEEAAHAAAGFDVEAASETLIALARLRGLRDGAPAAEEPWLRAARLLRARLGESDPRVARHLERMADFYGEELGQRDVADNVRSKAHAILEETLYPVDPRTPALAHRDATRAEHPRHARFRLERAADVARRTLVLDDPLRAEIAAALQRLPSPLAAPPAPTWSARS